MNGLIAAKRQANLIQNCVLAALPLKQAGRAPHYVKLAVTRVFFKGFVDINNLVCRASKQINFGDHHDVIELGQTGSQKG